MTERLLSKAEACDMLSIGLTKLNELVSAGDLPHVRIGRLVRFTLADLESYIEHNRIDFTGR